MSREWFDWIKWIERDSNEPEKGGGGEGKRRREGLARSGKSVKIIRAGWLVPVTPTGTTEEVSNGFCRGCLSGTASWLRLEMAHPPPDTNYCIASSASGCPIELSSPLLPPTLLLHLGTPRIPGLRTTPPSPVRFQPSPFPPTTPLFKPNLPSGFGIIRIYSIPISLDMKSLKDPLVLNAEE